MFSYDVHTIFNNGTSCSFSAPFFVYSTNHHLWKDCRGNKTKLELSYTNNNNNNNNNSSNNTIRVNRFLSREWFYLRNKFPLVRLFRLTSQHKFHPPYEAAMQQFGVLFLKMFFKNFHISRISLKSFFPSLERARQLETKKPKKDYYGPFYGLALSR